jgi:hypothetical protein
MLRSDTVAAIAKALAKAQAEMKAAAKDHVNPAFKSKYADLASVWEVARSCLPKNDIAVFQNVTRLENGIGVETMLLHSSGEWIQSDPFFVPVSRPDAHGTMSAVTYGKRGSLCAVCGIVADEPDDDGNAASGKEPPRTAKQTFSVNDGNRDAPPESWTGPMKKTALKNAITALVKDLKDCTDVSTLQGIWADNKAVVDQAQLDLPDWYDRLEAVLMDQETSLTHNPLAAA